MIDYNNVNLVITVGDNDATLAFPYSEGTLELLLAAKPLYKTSNWRGVPEFQDTDRKTHIAIVMNDTIKPLKKESSEEDPS
jgi:hypothetical protein